MTRHLITSAIPYINGVKHLGNLIGSQLPADLFARYQRARGNEVLFLCATDEHGTPAELAAAALGLWGHRVVRLATHIVAAGMSQRPTRSLEMASGKGAGAKEQAGTAQRLYCYAGCHGEGDDGSPVVR